VLFLRGHLPPSWLASIGAFCYVDPELFRWFLRYRAGPESDYYFDSAPSLMSNIFRFKFFTIGSKSYRYRSSQEVVDALRGKAASDFQRYQTELRGNWALKAGDSIVRDFHVLDERHCVIEQEIVVSIFDIGKTWMGMIFGTSIIDRFILIASILSHRLYRCRVRP
jgi:phage terminase large subunit